MIADMTAACARYVQNDICQLLEDACDTALGQCNETWHVKVDERDPDAQTLLFVYPPAVTIDLSTAYIEPAVRLEFGSRGDPWPTARVNIQPYAAEHFPNVFTKPQVSVTALTAERTFWEKVTILHQEAHRPEIKSMPDRCSRHYYDLAMLASSSVQAALNEAWTVTDDWLVGYYLVMPDHIHLFCAPGWPVPRSLKRWAGHWKRLVSLARPEIRGNWQRDVWDTQMRNADHYRRKLEYVQQNPVRQNLTACSEKWPYQRRSRELSWW